MTHQAEYAVGGNFCGRNISKEKRCQYVPSAEWAEQMPEFYGGGPGVSSEQQENKEKQVGKKTPVRQREPEKNGPWALRYGVTVDIFGQGTKTGKGDISVILVVQPSQVTCVKQANQNKKKRKKIVETVRQVGFLVFCP